MNIPQFRDVFMLNNLPKLDPKYDKKAFSRGTDTLGSKSEHVVNYYDSFGDLLSPNELINYLHKEFCPANKIVNKNDGNSMWSSVFKISSTSHT